MILIEHLKLVSFTENRVYSAEFDFSSGLNIIRAGNTSGKSTSMQAILYGLGMQRMLGPSLDIPLPYAMRDRIRADKNAFAEPVHEAYVSLKIRNSYGDVINIKRATAGEQNFKIINVTSNKRVSDLVDFDRRDFYVHDGGSATNELGFHNFLARFSGLELPTVPRYDGFETLLYLETIFPLSFVEQKRGWSVVQGPFPTYLSIQDMPRRVMEFILNLDVATLRRERADKQRLLQIEIQKWEQELKRAKDLTGGLLRIEGLPKAPSSDFLRNPDFEIKIFHEGQWIAIDEARKTLADEIKRIEEAETSTVSDAQPRLEEKLRSLQSKEQTLETDKTVLRSEYILIAEELQSVTERLDTLSIDLARNKDTKKLESLGAEVAKAIALEECPTCQRPVPTELLPVVSAPALSLDENIAYLNSQLDVFRAMERSLVARREEMELKFNAASEALSGIRSAIRDVRDDLTRAGSALSRSDIEKVVRLENKILRWGEVEESLQEIVSDLTEIAARWVPLKARLMELRNITLSAADKTKLSYLQDQVRSFLKEFSFSSFAPDEITISTDHFRPQVYILTDDGEHIEKDISFNASASDGIRLKWAYYMSVLLCSLRFGGNHPGFIVFDEPGQQEISRNDLIKFFNLAADLQEGQIIITTSEDAAVIRSGLDLTSVNFHEVDGLLLKPE